MRKFITADEAGTLLPEGNQIHTFYQTGNVLIGSDWDKSDILQKFRECDKIEITGEQARSMKHGLAVYKSDTKWQSEVLFVETDEDKINLFDPIMEGDDESGIRIHTDKLEGNNDRN